MTVTLSRPLSGFEHFFRSRTASDFYTNFQVTATYSLPLSLSTIYHGLRGLLLQYPIFASNVVKRSDDCYFEPIAPATLKDILTIVDDDSFLTDGVVNEKYLKFINLIRFSFYDNSPLFKLYLVDGIHLTVVLEHTIADGLVGPYFHQIFLDKVLSKGVEDATVTWDSEVFNFQRDMDLLGSLPAPIDDYLPPYTIDYGPTVDKNIPLSHPSKWPGRFASDYNVPIAFKLIHITPEQVGRILSKCKLEKVSLTSYLQIIHSMIIGNVIGQDHYSSQRVAISLRRFIDPEKILTPYYVASAAHSGLAMNLPPITEFTWDLVREVYSYLQQYVNNNKLLNTFTGFYNVYDKLEDNRNFFAQNMDKDRADSVKLSNLGLIKFPQTGKLTVTNLVFAQDVMAFSTDFMLNAISTETGGLNLVWSYFERTEADSLQPLVEVFRKYLLQYIEI